MLKNAVDIIYYRAVYVASLIEARSVIARFGMVWRVEVRSPYHTISAIPINRSP